MGMRVNQCTFLRGISVNIGRSSGFVLLYRTLAIETRHTATGAQLLSSDRKDGHAIHPPPRHARLVLYFIHEGVLRVTGLGFMVENVGCPPSSKHPPCPRIEMWLIAYRTDSPRLVSFILVLTSLQISRLLP